MILLVRADERLIHGQTMQFIVPENSITRIIVVDDLTATNALLKSIFETAVPKHISATVHTVEESRIPIEEALKDDVKTLLLIRAPRVFEMLRLRVSGLPDVLNIGSQMARNGVKCTEYATLLPEDITACVALASENVRVYFNAIGTSGAIVEWASVAKNLKL